VPSYQTFNPYVRQVPQAVPGIPAYLLGSYNSNVAPTKITITNTVLTTNVATFTGVVKEGLAPVVGQLMSIFVETNGATYNVSEQPVTAASFDATTGIGTFNIAITHANIGSAANTGQAIGFAPQVGEALANGSSLQLALPSNTGPNNGRSIRFDASFPSLPTAVTVTAQSAVIDEDSEYTDLGTVTSVSGGVQSGGSVIFTDIVAEFVRFKIASVSGGSSPKIIGKVTI